MSQYYQLAVNKLDVYINDNKNPFTPYLEKAEKMSGVKRIYIAQALIAVLGLYLIVGRAAQFVCNLLGFAYPAYKSLCALETSQSDDDTKWLTYWVVFAGFSVFEFFSDILLSWFPFYWLVKVVFLVWCCADIPNNGSTVLYSRVIRPLFLKNKDKFLGKNAGQTPEQSNSKSN